MISTFLCGGMNVVMGQIFPDLSGDELVEALQNAYTPEQLLNDAQAKDTLYFRIWRHQDSVRCIYTGLSRYLPEGVDPSQFLYGSGLEVESINLEHSWPQSKGAGKGTDGNVNMHHLFPSRSAVNSDRADFPFQEISDGSTQRWYYRNLEMSNKPNSNIDFYSEFAASRFEPRESVKGDIARALFYFWTIYREDAIVADPDFFNQQLETLCQWHHQDPVDTEEAARNEMIASYQGGKINPFISDCSLVMRAYCGSLPPCIMVNSMEPEYTDSLQLRFSNETQVFTLFGMPESQSWELWIFDSTGRVIVRHKVNGQSWSLDSGLPAGYYNALARVQNRWLSIGLVAY